MIMDEMRTSSAIIEQLLQSTHDEALVRNEVQEEKWKSYSQENEELCSRLLTLRDKLKHNVMVPVGKKALFKGSLVHTNEILVSLGDGWFARKSVSEAVETCKRKMKECDEMLERFKREKDLLISRKTFPLQNDVFGGRDEIIEPFNEEEEDKWREKHKESLKRYRKELKAQREREEENKDCNTDIFKILDSLEFQEKNTDELNRLVEDEDQVRFVQKHVKKEVNQRKATLVNGNDSENGMNVSHNTEETHLMAKSSQQKIESTVLRSIENFNVNNCNLNDSEAGDNFGYFDDQDEDYDDEEEYEDDDLDDEVDGDDDCGNTENPLEELLSTRSQENVKNLLKCSELGGINYEKKKNSETVKKEKSVRFCSENDKLNVVHIFHNDCRAKNDNEDEEYAAVIHFKHTDQVPSSEMVFTESEYAEPIINSPSDLYKCFSNCRKVGKSILKVSENMTMPCRESAVLLPASSLAFQAVREVVEHDGTSHTTDQPPRPVSRFKAARLAAKR